MADQKGGGITWTEETWNPLRGCSRVSEGCRNCYAEGVAARFSGPGQPYEGLAKFVDGDARWTGEVKLIEDKLNDPIRWQRPRRIFVNSMSDLFHEKVGNATIARIFQVMKKARHHEFQCLTKRVERMVEWFKTASARIHYWEDLDENHKRLVEEHIWIGISVEDQKTADARIPLLLQVPARTRWLSIEPQIGSVNLEPWLRRAFEAQEKAIHWVVIGGESGTGARPFDVGWASDLVDVCKRFGVAAFVKQMGHNPIFRYEERDKHPHLRFTGKGSDPAEWPKNIRVQEYPR